MLSSEDKSHGRGPIDVHHVPAKSITRFQFPGFGLPLNFTPYEAYDTQKWNGKKCEPVMSNLRAKV
jgi:hypothetical protein